MGYTRVKQTDVFQDDGFPFSINKGFLNEDCRMHSHEFKELFIITKGSSIHKTNSVGQNIFYINQNL